MNIAIGGGGGYYQCIISVLNVKLCTVLVRIELYSVILLLLTLATLQSQQYQAVAKFQSRIRWSILVRSYSNIVWFVQYMDWFIHSLRFYCPEGSPGMSGVSLLYEITGL